MKKSVAKEIPRQIKVRNITFDVSMTYHAKKISNEKKRMKLRIEKKSRLKEDVSLEDGISVQN